MAADVGKEQWQQHTGGDSDVGQEETHLRRHRCRAGPMAATHWKRLSHRAGTVATTHWRRLRCGARTVAATH